MPNCISISSGIFAGLTVVTDRETDRPRYFSYSNRSHLASTAMRPKTDMAASTQPTSTSTNTSTKYQVLQLCQQLVYRQHCSHYRLHRVSKKRPTVTTCDTFYIRSSIATIFGKNVAKKVGN